MSNNKRIAKNTLMLYFRSLLLMAITLYTSRVVLKELGVEDFGIYNLVGGVVVLFTFINSALAAAIQRFLNYELGKNDLEAVKKYFSIGVTVHIVMAMIVFILAETAGLWFLQRKLNIPVAKMDIAEMVFHFSVATTCISVLKIPYQSSIIAYEKMSFFAYASILEGIMKLSIAGALVFVDNHKLIVYAILMMIVSIVIFLVEFFYSRSKFITCKYRFVWDKELYKQVFSLSGWSLVGGVAYVGVTQGIGILLNIFFGVVINAAVGIATQVINALNTFVLNFQTAFRPQIVKSYAAGDKEYLADLIVGAAKFSFILLFTLAFPVFLNIDFILNLWLTDVPEYANYFIRLLLVYMLFESLSGPLFITMQATGKIKAYQIIISLPLISILVFSYIFMKMGYSPVAVYYVQASVGALNLFIRMIFVGRVLGYSIIRNLLSKIWRTVVMSLLVGVLFYFSTLKISDINKFFISLPMFGLVYAILVYFISLDKPHREKIKSIVTRKRVIK